MRLVPRCDAHREALPDSVDVKGVEPADPVVRGQASAGRIRQRTTAAHQADTNAYLRHHTVIVQIPGEAHDRGDSRRDGRLDISSVSQTSETLSRTQCNDRVEWRGAPTAGISLTSSSVPLPMTTVTMIIGKPATSAPRKQRTYSRQCC